MKTAEEYKESLRKMRANIYKFGELIEDVTIHPATKRTVEGHARIFDASLDPKYTKILTTKSSLTGERISRYLSIIRSPEDMYANVKMKRLMFHLTGTCTGGRCVGFNAINAMWATTYEMDKALGTNYHERLKRWLIDAQRRDITLAGALTDPKGDRSKSPYLQEDLDMSLRVIKEEEDGIYVKGAKVMISGVAAANEIFVMPGSSYDERNKDYAVSFVIPRDVENLTVVETRRPSDGREYEKGFDIPVDTGISQAYLLFEDVFIPKKRVFMCKEFEFTSEAVFNFTVPYRAAMGGCVAGQGDIIIGASMLMARANGLEGKFKEKVTRMIINNEITFGMGIASGALGKHHESGVWIPNALLSNVNKVQVSTLPYETKRLAQEIAGGIGETGCLPSYEDIVNERYGELIKKYLKAKCSGERRAKIARLIEWLTIGAGVPGCLHGGGSPDAARRIIRAEYKLEHYIKLAERLVNL
jgi:4-hydroxybutyryl-CoA dehydratase/vinylacetyl-CoA-Delta-isomerase